MKFHGNIVRSYWQRRQGTSPGSRALRRCDEVLERTMRHAISDVERAVTRSGSGAEAIVSQALLTIEESSAGLIALRRVQAGHSVHRAAGPDVIELVTSTRFLRRLHQSFLEQPDKEQLVFVTGPQTEDGTRVLSEEHAVPLAEQSSSYVRAAPDESHNYLVSLQRDCGHQLHAVVHSHLGNGEAITQPSSIDIDADRRWQALGCKALTGIASLDGHIRFLSTWFDFSLSCFGSGVEVLSTAPRETIIKLTD